MRTLLSDWCAFCEGAAVFDKSHFLGLLKEHGTDVELRKIFGYFPSSLDLHAKAVKVISSGSLDGSLYLRPRFSTSREEIVRLGSEWLRGQEEICGKIGDVEIEGICRRAKVVFAAESDLDSALQRDIPHHWLFDGIGDSLRASRISESDQVYALLEALYGLAADYYLAWYIGGSLFELDVDFGPYFEFWRMGGRCALTETEFLISNQ